MLHRFCPSLTGVGLQNERAEQLRSLSFLAGILLSFGMAALYQLVFEVDSFAPRSKIFYGLTIALTVSLHKPPDPLNYLPRPKAYPQPIHSKRLSGFIITGVK